MTDPTVDATTAVCWCRTCGTSSSAPGWAAQHHRATGHQTSRRRWTVETWRADNPTTPTTRKGNTR